MQQVSVKQRTVWLVVGLLTGLGIAYLWPHEPAYAATDRTPQYAMCTCPVGAGLDSIFVLNFLTGRLEGRVLNPILNQITHSYFRNVGNDFNLAQTPNPQFTIVAGEMPLNSVGGISMAQGVIYVAEIKTGQVVCYGFAYAQVNQPVPPFEMIVVDRFQFQESQ